jgi:predicted dehydrogenase
MPETRVAIAGTGNAAEMQAEAIEDLDGVRVVAAAARSEASAKAFAEAYDCDAFVDVDQMLGTCNPDQFHVCTPSGAHLDPTLTAVDHGVDVLCEKPLEITTDRIDRMATAAEEAGVRLGGIFQQRFAPVLNEIHTAAANGRFGTLSVANAYVPWWRDDDYYRGSWKGTQALDGGGALMNQSIHGVDAIQWLASAAESGAGQPPESAENPVASVQAVTGTLAHDAGDVEVEDTAVATIRYRSGAVGQLLAATSMYPGSRRRLQLGGRDGTVTVEEDELVTWQFREERETDQETRDRFGPSDTSGGAADPTDVDLSNHRRNVRAFVEARRRDEPFVLDATEARKAVAIVEAIYESAERERPVAPA